jgi:hypothetical protein
MRSNVCKIEKGTRDLDAILKECEKVALYNDLSHKQSLHLRLVKRRNMSAETARSQSISKRSFARGMFS